MPKLLSSDAVVKILIRNGLFLHSQKGSHAKYIRERCRVIVPMGRKEIPIGTLKSIIRQSGLRNEVFGK